MSALSQISVAVRNALRMLFPSDRDVVSSEAKEILSNPDDREKILSAVENLRNNPEKKETIKLSNNEELTLVS